MCPEHEHEYGFMGLLVIIDEKPQNDLGPSNVGSQPVWALQC
jgi:hypothetical protein